MELSLVMKNWKIVQPEKNKNQGQSKRIRK